MLPLQNMRIVLAGSVPSVKASGDPSQWNAIDIMRTVGNVARQILLDGGEIMHGGHPTFVRILAGVAPAAIAETPPSPDLPARRVHLFIVKPFLSPAEDKMYFNDGKHSQYATLQAIGELKSNKGQSLKEMRELLLADINALVSVGGELHTDGARAPGVGEEAGDTIDRGIPTFISGAAGGYSSKFVSMIGNPAELADRCRLTKEEFLELGTTANPTRAAVLIIQGLRDIAARAVAQQKNRQS